MIIDIRKDLPDFRAYLVERTAAYSRIASNQPVSRIHFGFEYGQTNYVVLVLDSRPNAEPDGQWTMEVDKMIDEKTALMRPQWPLCDEVAEAEQVSFIDISGKEVDVIENPDQLICDIIGAALKQVLISARNDGIFKSLPKQTRCEMSVENIEGYYGWPHYKNRGCENLA